MKQAMVDKNPNIATAALISSLKQAEMNSVGLEVVKRKGFSERIWKRKSNVRLTNSFCSIIQLKLIENHNV